MTANISTMLSTMLSTNSRSLRLATLVTILALTCGAPLSAQEGDQKQDKQDPKPVSNKLTEWPSIKKAESDRVRAVAKQYHKQKAELDADATQKLIQTGPAVAPILIPLVNDRPESINRHLFEVFDAVLNKSHASLMARESNRPSVEWRRYMMRRLAGFHDADMAAVFKPALKDKDQDIAFYASLGLLALGQHDGLDVMLLAAKQRWAEFGDITAAVLPASRSNENAMPVFEKIAAAQPTDQMAGLRLLRYLMVKEQGVLLRRYLESSDFTVKKEAINTARVLHGEQPLDKLSSFHAIDQAKKWLSKL